MTTISPLRPTDVLAASSTASRIVSYDGASFSAGNSPSTFVALGQSNVAGAGLYSLNNPAPANAPLTWTRAVSGKTTSFTATDDASLSSAQRFQGLGSMLLDRIKDDGSLPAAANQADAISNTNGIAAPASGRDADKQIKLDIKTAGGATVSLTVAKQGDALAVQIQIAGGTLSDDERAHMEKLADAFQKTVDGLTDSPPRLELAGIAQFDTRFISSLDLHVGLDDKYASTLDFHADSKQRTVSAGTPAGLVKMSVDLSNPAIIGSAKQQAQTMNQYLQQFTDAGRRGHGDSSLLSMFSDAFVAINSNYGAATQQTSSSPSSTADWLSKRDHGLLTGLTDFSASIGANTESINPMRPGEVDSFSYRVSQSTSVRGPDAADRAISQKQDAHLTASYHAPISPGVPLKLTGDPHSQNYTYTQIEDDASSTTELGYRQGKLFKASINQSASQTTHVMKYMMGQLIADTVTPSTASYVKDLLSSLSKIRPGDDGESASAGASWSQQLGALRNNIFLQPDPGMLRAHGGK